MGVSKKSKVAEISIWVYFNSLRWLHSSCLFTLTFTDSRYLHILNFNTGRKEDVKENTIDVYGNHTSFCVNVLAIELQIWTFNNLLVWKTHSTLLDWSCWYKSKRKVTHCLCDICRFINDINKTIKPSEKLAVFTVKNLTLDINVWKKVQKRFLVCLLF